MDIESVFSFSGRRGRLVFLRKEPPKNRTQEVHRTKSNIIFLSLKHYAIQQNRKQIVKVLE